MHKLPRYQRLCSPAQYKRIFDGGTRIRTGCLTFLFRHNELEYSRVGYALSKKAIKTAVARNQIKRMIRESLRRHQPFSESVDIIALSRQQTAQCSKSDICKCIEKAWENLNKQLKQLRAG